MHTRHKPATRDGDERSARQTAAIRACRAELTALVAARRAVATAACAHVATGGVTAGMGAALAGLDALGALDAGDR